MASFAQQSRTRPGAGRRVRRGTGLSRRVRFGALAVLTAIAVVATPSQGVRAEPAYGEYRWPVRGPILQPYQTLPSPYSAGHRGIDIAAAIGTPIAAPADGVVAFAGQVGGDLFISIDHPDGVRTTFSWVATTDVRRNQPVSAGDVIGTTSAGHPTGGPSPHLHVGARYAGSYLDPMLLFEPLDVVDLIALVPAG